MLCFFLRFATLDLSLDYFTDDCSHENCPQLFCFLFLFFFFEFILKFLRECFDFTLLFFVSFGREFH